MFNLVHDPWLPVEQTDGSLTNVSIYQALTRAHTFRRLVHASPVVLPSMHRLLLAILHRALRGPEDAEIAAEWFEQGRFPTDKLEAYLEQWQDRFELFHAEKPFYQVANSDDKVSSLARLAAELASGTNKLLFDHTHVQDVPTLEHAEVAQLLIARQMTAIPEGAGYSPSPVGGVAFVLPQGDNLFETLSLNLVPYRYDEADMPIWEQAAPKANSVKNQKPRAAKGLCERYTWLTRIIKFQEPVADGKVEAMHYAAGIKFDDESPDPMLAYRKDSKRGLLPINFRRDKAFWRDFQALAPTAESAYLAPRTLRHASDIYEELGKKEALTLLVTGLTNDKAKVLLWRTLQFRFPEALQQENGQAQQELERLLELADKAHNELRRATYHLATHLLTMGERSPDKNDISNLIKSLPSSVYFWSQLERHFPELLEKFSESYANQLAWWKDTIANVIGEAWQLAVKSAGENERAWRAASKSGGIVGKYIKELKEAA